MNKDNRTNQQDEMHNISSPSIHYAERDPENSLPSARAILAGAFGNVAQTDAEKKSVEAYRKNADRYNRLEGELNALLEKRRLLYVNKGSQEAKNEVRADINKLKAELDAADRTLLDLQMSAPLRDMVAREREKVYKEQLAKSQERQAEYRAAVHERSEQKIRDAVAKEQANQSLPSSSTNLENGKNNPEADVVSSNGLHEKQIGTKVNDENPRAILLNKNEVIAESDQEKRAINEFKNVFHLLSVTVEQNQILVDKLELLEQQQQSNLEVDDQRKLVKLSNKMLGIIKKKEEDLYQSPILQEIITRETGRIKTRNNDMLSAQTQEFKTKINQKERNTDLQKEHRQTKTLGTVDASNDDKKDKFSIVSVISFLISVSALGMYGMLFEGINLFLLWIICSVASIILPIFAKSNRLKKDLRGKAFEVVALVIGSFNLYSVFFAATKIPLVVAYVVIAICCFVYAKISN